MLKRIFSRLGWLVFPFAIAGIIILSLLYFLLWRQLIGDFKLRTTTDFEAFYAAGRVAQTEGPSQVYNLVSQKAVEESVSGSSIQLDEVNPFVHPPFVVFLLRLIVQSDFVSSYQNWALVMSALFVISTIFLILSLPNISKKESLLLFFASLLFFPGMVSILNGQDSAILLLGGAIWLYGLVKGKYRLAGLGLALTTIRPQISIILAFPFIFKFRRIWWWYCIGVAFLVVASLLTMGPENIYGFLRILTVSAGGKGYWINEFAMVNLLGLLRNIFPGVSPDVLRYVSWVSFLIVSVGVCLLWTRSNLVLEHYITLAVILSIFFSPHLHYHDLVLLLLPLFGNIRLLLKKRMASATSLALALLFMSFLMLANDLIPLLHIVPFLMMVLLVSGIWLMKKMDSAYLPVDETHS